MTISEMAQQNAYRIVKSMQGIVTYNWGEVVEQDCPGIGQCTDCDGDPCSEWDRLKGNCGICFAPLQ